MVTTFGMNDLDILPKKFYVRLVETLLVCPVTFLFPKKFLYVGVAHKGKSLLHHSQSL